MTSQVIPRFHSHDKILQVNYTLFVLKKYTHRYSLKTKLNVMQISSNPRTTRQTLPDQCEAPSKRKNPPNSQVPPKRSARPANLGGRDTDFIPKKSSTDSIVHSLCRVPCVYTIDRRTSPEGGIRSSPLEPGARHRNPVTYLIGGHFNVESMGGWGDALRFLQLLRQPSSSPFWYG